MKFDHIGEKPADRQKLQKDLTGRTFGDLKVIGYVQHNGQNQWLCQCSCGNLTYVDQSYALTSGHKKSCGHRAVGLRTAEDLTGRQFGEWTVLRYDKASRWICRCSCGVEKQVLAWHLTTGGTTSCGHIVDDKIGPHPELIGKHINMLTVIEYDKNRVKYKCQCDCGNITYATSTMLLDKKVISCGCSKIKYLPGQKINNIELLERIDSVHWKSRCHCGKEFIAMTSNLTKGHTMSCGCQRLERFQATMKERYGEVSYAKVDTDRTPEQLQWVDNRENFRNFLQTYFNHKPSQQEVMRVIGMNQGNTRKVIDRFDSWDLIDNQLKVQSYEKELWDLFPGSKVSDRKTLGGRELDMLFQSKGIAIEFNGDYWHSEYYKNINNHAYKQKACRVQGINLIHLYEHEFEDQQIKDKCVALVRCALNDESVADLTDMEAKVIDSQMAEKFIADNSLYEYRDGCINMGLVDKTGNIKILTQVSKSDNKATIDNMAWNIELTGGVQQLVRVLMTSVIKLLKLDSLELTLDFDKLSWIKMGQQFKNCQILQPGYVWINTEGHKIKVVNHAKCEEMIKNNEIQTEDDLYRLNYCKLYNSGYLKYIWSIKD